MFLKLFGLGVVEYCKNLWNVFDGFITIVGVISVPLDLIYKTQFLMAVRPIRLFRLFASMKRFRDIFETFVMIFHRLKESIIILFLIYYIFGIIGIELFQGYDFQNCCKNSSVESAFSTEGAYYLNNFKDLPRSYVTLFELMVVNNWNIIMEGFAIVVGDWSRIFFMTYYLSNMIVLTIVVSLILESFLLIQQQQQQELINNQDTKTLITLNKQELNPRNTILEEGVDNDQDQIQFEGKKRSNREDLHSLLHPEMIKEWTEEAERLENRRRSLSENPEFSGDQAIDISGSRRGKWMTLSRQLLSQRTLQ